MQEKEKKSEKMELEYQAELMMVDKNTQIKVDETKRAKDAIIENLTGKYDNVVLELKVLRKNLEAAVEKKVSSFRREARQEILNIRLETQERIENMYREFYKYADQLEEEFEIKNAEKRKTVSKTSKSDKPSSLTYQSLETNQTLNSKEVNTEEIDEQIDQIQTKMKKLQNIVANQIEINSQSPYLEDNECESEQKN